MGARKTAAELAAEAKHAERMKIREDQPGSWIAVDPEDQLIGVVTDVDQAWSDVRNNTGAWYPLLRVRVEEANGYAPDQELTVHAFGAVLYSELMKRRPIVGERVKIIYLGEGEIRVKGQNAPKIYRVTVFGREHEGASVYDRIGVDNPSDPRRGRGRTAQAPASDIPADGSFQPNPPAAAGAQQDEDIPF